MVKMSENKEATLVAVGSASGALAAYLSTQPIPDQVKVPLVVVLGAISVGILAYWKVKVNPLEEA